MSLGVDPGDLAACVSCGLCLPHCPTFRVSGEESRSPRGRIAAMRVVESGAAPIDEHFVRVIDECVGCRGCETACPSSVPYGRLLEASREALVSGDGGPSSTPWYKRAILRSLRWHSAVLVASSALAVAQRVGVVRPRLARRLGLPDRLPLRRPPLVDSREGGEPLWLFAGCVMDAWLRQVHIDTQSVIEASGGRVRYPDPQGPARRAGAGCCGALHQHAGLRAGAADAARAVMASMPGNDPVVVNSAGCGAAMIDYAHLLGTEEAARFAARVTDVHTWVASRVDRLPPPTPGWRPPEVAVQDPCHLRHVQRAHQPVRAVLARYATVLELDDEGLCCGAGGAYRVEQPALANAIRDRKVAAIERTGAMLVASANPGCMLHLAAAGVDARHPLSIVAEAIGAREKQ